MMIGVVISQMVSISYTAVSLPSLCVKESSLDLMLVHLVNIKLNFGPLFLTLLLSPGG